METIQFKPGERFRTIKNFEKYQISNYGRVLAYTKSQPRFLKPSKDAMGYLHVRLYSNTLPVEYYANGMKKPTLFKVHRLVGKYFVRQGTKRGKLKDEINHIDCDKTNNHYKNLEWVTRSENINKAWEKGLMQKGFMKGRQKMMKPVCIEYLDGTKIYFECTNYAYVGMQNEISHTALYHRIYQGAGFGKKGIKAYQIDKLPVGETYQKILNIESEMIKYYRQFWPKRKHSIYYSTEEFKKIQKKI